MDNRKTLRWSGTGAHHKRRGWKSTFSQIDENKGSINGCLQLMGRCLTVLLRLRRQSWALLGSAH